MADKAYAQLAFIWETSLRAIRPPSIPELRADVLSFFKDPSLPFAAKQDPPKNGARLSPLSTSSKSAASACSPLS